MDFSNYPPEHDNFNIDKYLKPGYFKDENGLFFFVNVQVCNLI